MLIAATKTIVESVGIHGQNNMFQDFVTVFNLAYCCHTSHFLAETDHNPPLQNSYFNYLGSKLKTLKSIGNGTWLVSDSRKVLKLLKQLFNELLVRRMQLKTFEFNSLFIHCTDPNQLQTITPSLPTAGGLLAEPALLRQ